MSDQGHQLTEQDAKDSLRNHIVVKTAEARQKYGEDIGESEILAMLSDSEVVRYETRLAFDTDALQEGEFAFVQPIGTHPSEGFILHVHPALRGNTRDLPLAIAYHLVVINYGDIAGSDEAELFGANLLGLDKDIYYDRLCQIADGLS